MRPLSFRLGARLGFFIHQIHIEHSERDKKSGIWDPTLKGNYSSLGELRMCFGTIWVDWPKRRFIVFR